jgi:hypothetical protein
MYLKLSYLIAMICARDRISTDRLAKSHNSGKFMIRPSVRNIYAETCMLSGANSEHHTEFFTVEGFIQLRWASGRSQ